MKPIEIRTRNRVELVDITSTIQAAVDEKGVKEGVCHVFVPHTTAGVTINEGADPSVCRDIERHFSKLVPRDDGFEHAEGNSDSHIKASMMGASQTIFIEGGRLVLGIWQAIYLCEFDGPRTRKVLVKIV
jgi:secondary thiamine-phosphate synthase enzyme